MNYNISNSMDNPYSKNLGIEISPPNNVLTTFLISLDLSKLGELLKKMALSQSYYQIHQSVKPYCDLDWEDLKELKEVGGINENEVAIYHEVLGDLIMNESQFCHIIIDYALMHLKVYRYDKEFSEHWTEGVKTGIEELQKKLNYS